VNSAMVSNRNWVFSLSALPPTSMRVWPASTPTDAPRFSVTSFNWSKFRRSVPRRMALAANEASPAFSGGSYMAPPLIERRADRAGVLVLGYTSTVRPLPSTRRVIVSGPSALLSASLAVCIVIFGSILRIIRVFVGRDEPAYRAVVLRQIHASHALYVGGGHCSQLVEHLVVHIRAVNALQE